MYQFSDSQKQVLRERLQVMQSVEACAVSEADNKSLV